jgi:glutamate 5-kinase
MAGGAGSAIGRGGMLTKVLAAKRAARSGASTVIASGREPDVLLRLAAGEAIGTALIAPRPSSPRASNGWPTICSCAARCASTHGAVAKLRDEGKSLLPIGMVEVQGEFARGDVIAVRSLRVSRSRAAWPTTASSEARLIARKPSSEFERLLGFTGEPEMIHRDNMILA